ncbi:MAG: hypothetical protein WC785_06890 [Tatlockia sp.]|jgi:hypothetical protein
MKTMRSILGCILLLLIISSNSYAGTPVWTFAPLTPTTVSINQGDTAFVFYRVTNRSFKRHALVISPIQGVTQLEQGTLACSSARVIGFGESCNLLLKIEANNIPTGRIFGGPILCQNGNRLECYRPSQANRLNITVNRGPQQFTIGGTVTGLIGTVVLQKGTELLPINTDGVFTFATKQTTGSPYLVTIQSQPAGQTCTLINRAGVVGTANVTNVRVICNSQTYTVGGTINGLAGTVVLQNNGDTVSVTSPTNLFTFPAQANGSTYAVTVQTQPAGQTCAVANGTGVVSGANVTNVVVTCSNLTYTIGGTVTGLALGGTVVLSNFGADFLPVTSNGSFTFPDALPNGSPYAVTVATNPAGQFCQVTNGIGIIAGANVTNILVSCTSAVATLTVSPTGLIPINGIGSITVQNTSNFFIAQNVHAILPNGWTDVTQDASNCLVLNPLASCTLNFTSGGQPYVAQGGIQITGDNVSQPYPVTALAFTINGFAVYGVDSLTSATVVDTLNPTAGFIQWTNPSNVPVGALSLTDGFANTAAVAATGFAGAVSYCYNATFGGASIGTWYMAAICQMGPSGQAASCPSGVANIQQNLGALGFYSSFINVWSSTEFAGNPQTEVWIQDIGTPAQGISQQYVDSKDSQPTAYLVLCSRSIPY